MSQLKKFIHTYKTYIIGATIEAVILVSLNKILPPALAEVAAGITSLAIKLTH